jgi:hypothetical protein
MRKATLALVLMGMTATPLLADGIGSLRGAGNVLVAVAAGADDPSSPGRPHARQVVTTFLALTPDQVTQWDTLLASREAAVAPLRDQLESTTDQLKELLDSTDPDPGAVGTLVISAKTLREGIQASDATYAESFAGLLDQGQKAKLTAVRHAARLAPVLPAFGLLGLLPPPPHAAAQ